MLISCNEIHSLTCHGRKKYTDENGEGRSEIDLNLVVARACQKIHVLRIVPVGD